MTDKAPLASILACVLEAIGRRVVWSRVAYSQRGIFFFIIFMLALVHVLILLPV